MAIFRNVTLQRLFCAAFIWTALLSHTQLLFACEFMHGKATLVCCCDEAMSEPCPMIESCAMQETTDQSQCCEVSQDSLIDASMSPGTSTAQILTLLLDSPQPPPPINFGEFNVSRKPYQLSAVLLYESLLPTGNRQTYLRTLRIRL